MIEINNLTKTFDKTTALDNISLKIGDKKIFGLLGSNGAGKSTLLRIIADVFYADSGEVLINGEAPRKNPEIKKNVFFMPDEPYFYVGATIKNLANFYKDFYPGFSMDTVVKLAEILHLDIKKSISGFSKGMKRQAMLIMALASNAKLLLLDEVFDGIDVNARKLLKKYIPSLIEKNNATIIISTHNLNEIDNFADELCLFINGKIVYESSMDELKEQCIKIRCAFSETPAENNFKVDFILNYKLDGKIAEFIVSDIEKANKYLNGFKPLFTETKSISVDELFLLYMEKEGYSLDGIDLSFENI